MTARDIYANGFDEDSGRTVPADSCPECEGRLCTEGGETSCETCGLIVDSARLDRGRPTSRRYANNGESNEQTGAPRTAARHDRGLSTKVGRWVDGNGNSLSGSKRRKFARLRKQQRRGKFRSKAERNLAKGFTEIARIVSSLDLSRTVREQASTLFRQAQDQDLLRGRSIEAMAAGSVYGACRCNGIIRTLNDVASRARCSNDSVANAYRVLNLELELPVPPQLPGEFVPGHASALDVPTMVERTARRYAEDARETGLSVGKNPSAFAAACLAVAAHEHDVQVTQLEIARVADVCPATVRGHRDRLREQILDEQ